MLTKPFDQHFLQTNYTHQLVDHVKSLPTLSTFFPSPSPKDTPSNCSRYRDQHARYSNHITGEKRPRRGNLREMNRFCSLPTLDSGTLIRW